MMRIQFLLTGRMILVLLVSLSCSLGVSAGSDDKKPDPSISLDLIYKNAVAVYADERWSECIRQFEEVLHLFKLYKSVIVNCRRKCNEQGYDPIVADKIDDLAVYELYFRKTECLLTCQQIGYKSLKMNGEITSKTLEELVALKPYEYLHYCYLRMNLIPKAASAVLTFIEKNPKNEKMIENYKYYISQPEVDEKEVIDLESDDYKFLYKQGVTAYENGRWGETIANMEETIQDFLASENNCRMFCEGPYDQGYLPDLATSIANHFIYALQCKQKCQRVVKSLNYESGSSFLADVLNYIQISYYRTDRLKEAARTVESYLLILPTDEDMLKNKEFYSSLVESDAFSARPDIVYYVKRDKYEKKLIRYAHTFWY